MEEIHEAVNKILKTAIMTMLLFLSCNHLAVARYCSVGVGVISSYAACKLFFNQKKEGNAISNI